MNYIYGAGKYGKKAYEILREIGIKIEGFCQTNCEEGMTVFELPVYEFDSLDIQDIVNIFIAIADQKICDKIRKKIGDSSNNKIRVINMSQTVELEMERAVARDVKRGKFFCLACGKKYDGFKAGGIESEFFKKNHVIGGGYRENCICPYCKSNDRARWLRYVIEHYVELSMEKRVLHFAPEESVRLYIKENVGDYYPCDIQRGRTTHVADVTDVQFKDNIFDMVIINHVLEHIIDEEKAISEIKRVLKQNGQLIISFPISLDTVTYEDLPRNTPEERLENYGQKDHIRLYGYDYKERLRNYGLEIKTYTPKDLLLESEIIENGFLPNDILMICTPIEN